MVIGRSNSTFAAAFLLATSALTPAFAQEVQQREYAIEAQPLRTALLEFSRQSNEPVIAPAALTSGRQAVAVQGRMSEQAALARLLEGTGLRAMPGPSGGWAVIQNPQGGSVGGEGADVDALIVTAQKREERLQDVPIAISAFSQKALEEQKIEGGYDLLKAIPNVTFSKSNFTSYNFSIRGVGTKAISATTDPGVAVAFNNTTLVQNRLFEQEYFDVERVEVLRGPQGTLYGRNATSGVINVISAKPKLSEFEGSAKIEVGNYSSKRLVGMVNIPIVEDMLAVRVAAAGTQRSGYDYNEVTGNNINGRDLWGGRVTVGFEPTPRLRADLLWEHFEEDDNRSRTGKQLCHRDPGRDVIGTTSTGRDHSSPYIALLRPAGFGQGCKAGSLYDKDAFGTPNGLSMPFIFATLNLQGDCGVGCTPVAWLGNNAAGRPEGIIKLEDPYGGLSQSRDLRTVASIRDPIYRAKADVFDLSIDFDVTDAITITSQTVYNKDEVYSFQDFNRFNSAPVFNDTSLWTEANGTPNSNPSEFRDLAPGGLFCDPQIGCSDRIAGFDISQADGKQFSQELRVQSDFDGPVNFSIGANYTTFETVVDYYVMYNILTALALSPPFYRPVNGVIDPAVCRNHGAYFPFFEESTGTVPSDHPSANCVYIDPNPVESINGDGHNYFRSKNPYELDSRAIFGELYWNIREDLKLTAGLRYTKDEKTFTPVPSQVLLAPGVVFGGTVSRGYPEDPPIVQEWGEWTGRLGLDWKPELSFTDETLLYAFYSRGYKGGGANPPTPGFATGPETEAFWLEWGGSPFMFFIVMDPPGADGQRPPILSLNAVEYGPTFEPEFVDALEIGAKSTLLGGAMTFNATGFYYDYKDYQVSQIRDRTAVNENFDAKIWGLEFETVFSPSRNLRINANLGYLDTKIADGESSIDIMNRTQGNPAYTLLKPWIQLPSNCVIPSHVAENWIKARIAGGLGNLGFADLCGGVTGFNGPNSVSVTTDTNPQFGNGLLPYDHRNYPELNGGGGLRAQLGGNELPNAPHWTMNAGAQYGRDILDGSWRVVMRGDAYWQSQSWARVYNAVNDKLHGWYNFNVSVRLENRDLGVEAEFYVKNLLDKSPITDAFLNSDDTALTTNVFVLDPRLVGFSLRKTF